MSKYKTRCDGKTHYTPTGDRTASLSKCDHVSEHTPGPWKVGNGGMIYTSDLRSAIAETRCEDTEWVEQSANARLIAAAPELLTALENVLKTMYASPELNIDIITRCSTTVKKAIAKAEGLQ